jgi:hypothetical protein
MFHPDGHAMERGWVGRIDGEHVVHLAAQTLQSFFLGGGHAREHAVYPLDGVRLLAPVLHPPTVRVFERPKEFAFANASAVASPGAAVAVPAGASAIEAWLRPAAVVGAEEAVGGYTLLLEVRAIGLTMPKDRDFALVLGPTLVTPEEWQPPGFDWDEALAYAHANTVLRAGDILAGPAVDRVAAGSGRSVALALEPLGALAAAIS